MPDLSPDLGYKNTTVNEAGGYLVPEPLANSIFKNIQNKSAVLPFLNKIPMTSSTLRLNAIDEDISMTWVDGEAGEKATDYETKRQITLTAYELAVVVPITEQLIEDANISMDALIREEIEDALVRALEQSYLGYYAGSPFAQTISGSCPVAHTVAFGDTVDLLTDISTALGYIEEDGFTDNIGFVAHPTLKAQLRNLRSAVEGIPLFQPANAAEPATLFGFPIRFTRNMVDQGSPTDHELIVADWKYMFEGVRNSLKLKKFDSGTVGDQNLILNDMVAIRATIRRAFAIRDTNAIAKVTGL